MKLPRSCQFLGRNCIQRQEALPGPLMRRTHRQRTKLIRSLAPPVIINSQHHSGYCYTDTNCLTHRPNVAGQRRSLKAITPQT